MSGSSDNFFRRGSRRGGWDTSSIADPTTGGGNEVGSRNYGSGSSYSTRDCGDGYGGGGNRSTSSYNTRGHGGGGGYGCSGLSYNTIGYGSSGALERIPRGLTTLTEDDWKSVRPSLTDDTARKLTLSPPSSLKKPLQPPARPGFGKLGLRCLVKANHFLVQLTAPGNFYRYTVSIEPDAPYKLNKDIMIALINTYKNSDPGNLTPVYDGRKILLTAKELPFIVKDFTVKLDDQGRTSARELEYKVTIKWASTIECRYLKQLLAAHQLETQHEMIHLLDAVLKSAEILKKYACLAVF